MWSTNLIKAQIKSKAHLSIFVEDFKCKDCQKQFKSQNIYIFFTHLA
jgi:transposase-like protein